FRDILVLADCPTRCAFQTAFNPPAVEDAQAWNSVKGGLHPTGPRGFLRTLRRIEPKIDTTGHEPCHRHAVVLEIMNLQGVTVQCGSRLEDAADHRFAPFVARVRLPCVQDLKRPDSLR